MPASNYLRTASINHFIRGIQQPAPPAAYMALFISDPTAANTGTEVTGGSYQRVPITFDLPVIGADKTTTYNNAKVEFAVATANWGRITDWAIFTAQNGGNMLYYDHFAIAQDILTGNQAAFNPNDCSISVK